MVCGPGIGVQTVSSGNPMTLKDVVVRQHSKIINNE